MLVVPAGKQFEAIRKQYTMLFSTRNFNDGDVPICLRILIESVPTPTDSVEPFLTAALFLDVTLKVLLAAEIGIAFGPALYDLRGDHASWLDYGARSFAVAIVGHAYFEL